MNRIPGIVLILIIIWTFRAARHSADSEERNLLYAIAGATSGYFLLQLYRSIH
jgi:hypothetical protein